jgi:hypothetical protein
MCKAKILIASAMLGLGMAPASHAQMVVDMSKFTCAQFLEGTSDSIETAIWLSGYYNGLHKNTKVDLKRLKHNADLVKNECHSNPKKTVMKIITTMLSRK